MNKQQIERDSLRYTRIFLEFNRGCKHSQNWKLCINYRSTVTCKFEKSEEYDLIAPEKDWNLYLSESAGVQ